MTRRLAVLAGALVAAATSVAGASSARPVAALTCVDVGPVTYDGNQVAPLIEACVPTP
ncbi:MAG TPA: hypothetical protein VN193_07440 [Candidatus Angelobacter sp.]|jgi:hypothetical protein|nr:hypothetical protein [Candidatus Angelobacter sp.]